MRKIIPGEAMKLWEEWNVRGSILFSLFLQILLIFCAPLRKRSGGTFVTLIIWLAYLLADWVAAFAVGLIINNQINMRYKRETPVQTEDLLAFWAPFLLLHLGGPDAITAFSLEDNELWTRHLLGLLIQLIAVVYVVIQALPSELWIPTTLMLLVGIIKYAERTRALYLGCLGNFNVATDIPKYAQLMEVYTSKKIAHVPAEIKIERALGDQASADDDIGSSLSDVKVVEDAFRYLSVFKGLTVGLMFTFHEQKDSRKFFFTSSAQHAFRVLEVELNFMYDFLYTKMVVVNGKIGYFLRFVCSTCLVASLERFAAHHKQKNGGHQPNQAKMHLFDVYVTYALLIGAICLDSIAVTKLISSDWTVVLLKSRPGAGEILAKTIERLGKWSKAFGGRWSNSMSQCSIVHYWLKERFKWIDVTADWFGIKDILDEIQYIKSMDVPLDLKEFIFTVLKEKAKKAEDSKIAWEESSRRGDWDLSPSTWHSLTESFDVEIDESLLLWHIATDLCYYEMDNAEDPEVGRPQSPPSRDSSTADNRRFSKFLSDYMLYLLVKRPTMVSAVAGNGQVSFRDTCNEAKEFFRRKEVIPGGQFKENSLLLWFKKFFRSSMAWFKKFCFQRNQEFKSGGQSESICKAWLKMFSSETRKKLMLQRVKIGFAELLLIETAVKPIEVKGDRSKSVLFDACILTKKLYELDEKKRWKVMSEVWVELLSYAANHCRSNTHAQQLSKGGELVTFVWLLMTHLGLGDEFRVEACHARAKLLVQK